MNARFKQRLHYDWLLYLVIAGLSVFIWIWIFTVYHAPKSFEKLGIFYAGHIKDYGLESKLEESLGDEAIEVSVYSSDPADSSFPTKFNVVGVNGSDILILPLSVAQKTNCAVCFKQIESGRFAANETFDAEGAAYGVILTDAQKSELGTYFAFTDERYAVFVAAASVNGGGDALTDNALRAVEIMLS